MIKFLAFFVFPALFLCLGSSLAGQSAARVYWVRVSYMCTTHALQLEGADDVGGELLGVRQRHAHHPVRLRPPTRPVLK